VIKVRAAVCAIFAVLGVAALAAPASAWEPPRKIADAANGVNDLQLVVTSKGETVAAWIEQNHEDIRGFAAVVRADGTFEPAVELARNLGGCVLDIATGGDGTVIVALAHSDGRAVAFRRPPGGSFGGPESVADSDSGSSIPALAMGTGGEAAILMRSFDPDTQSIRTVIHTSAGPEAWRAGPVISTDPEYGGFDVAVTPDGAAVGVWIVDPPRDDDNGGGGPLPGTPLEPPRERKPSAVKSATLFPDGRASAVQVLRESTSLKTCPEVEANALGQVAALWHEVDAYCGEWGGDVLALRPAGATQFKAPQVVPGAQSAAARGTLGLADDGRVTVTYDATNGGQLVSGPFDGTLTARKLDAAPIAVGSDPAGVDLVAVRTGNGYATRRHTADGRLSAPSPFGVENMSDYVRVDEAAGHAAGLALFDGGLQLLRQAADAPPPPGPPPPPPGGPSGPVAGGPGTPIGEPLSARIRRVRLDGRRVLVDVFCSVRCTVSARADVLGRRGRRVTLRTGARSVEGTGRLKARLSRRAVRRLGARPRVAVVRLEAKGPAGERSVAVLRPRHRSR
jgi:hypothetical protein